MSDEKPPPRAVFTTKEETCIPDVLGTFMLMHRKGDLPPMGWEQMTMPPFIASRRRSLEELRNTCPRSKAEREDHIIRVSERAVITGAADAIVDLSTLVMGPERESEEMQRAFAPFRSRLLHFATTTPLGQEAVATALRLASYVVRDHMLNTALADEMGEPQHKEVEDARSRPLTKDSPLGVRTSVAMSTFQVLSQQDHDYHLSTAMKRLNRDNTGDPNPPGMSDYVYAAPMAAITTPALRRAINNETIQDLLKDLPALANLLAVSDLKDGLEQAGARREKSGWKQDSSANVRNATLGAIRSIYLFAILLGSTRHPDMGAFISNLTEGECSLLRICLFRGLGDYARQLAESVPTPSEDEQEAGVSTLGEAASDFCAACLKEAPDLLPFPEEFTDELRTYDPDLPPLHDD